MSPKALKSCPKSKISPNLVTLIILLYLAKSKSSVSFLSPGVFGIVSVFSFILLSFDLFDPFVIFDTKTKKLCFEPDKAPKISNFHPHIGE